MASRSRIYCLVAIMLILLCPSLNALKAIVIPMPGPSHLGIMKVIAQELLKYGHNATLVITEDDGRMNDAIPTMTYKPNFVFDPKEVNNRFQKQGLLSIVATLHSVQVDICEVLMANSTILDSIKEYDIIVSDSCFSCSYLLPEMVQKPNILIHVAGIFVTMLPYPIFPNHPAYIPQPLTTYRTKMNFFQRVRNTIARCSKDFLLDQVVYYMIYGLKTKYNVRSDLTLHELMLRPNMILVPGDFVVEYARPVPPNVKLIGPLTPSPSSPLPEDLEEFMASSGQYGVLLVSMGTIYDFPENKIPLVVEAFKQIPQKVLWKARIKVNNLPSNVKVVKWMPQNDVLGHEKVIAFLTHGGSKGLYEAAYHAVPVIGVGIQAEQRLNLARASQYGFGIALDKDKFSVHDLVDAVTKIATEPWYKGNITRISNVIKSAPIPPRQALLHWIEYVANHDVHHLKSEEYILPFYQYYLLDVITFLAICIFLICSFLKHVVCWCCCRSKLDKVKPE